MHSGGVLCLNTAQRVWRVKSGMDLAVLVSRLAKPFSLFEQCPMSFFLPALLPCTGFGCEAAAEWGLPLEIFTLKPPVLWGFWYDLLAKKLFVSLYLCSNPHVLLKCFYMKGTDRFSSGASLPGEESRDFPALCFASLFISCACRGINIPCCSVNSFQVLPTMVRTFPIAFSPICQGPQER